MSDREYSHNTVNIVSAFFLFEVIMVPLISFSYLWLKVWFDILGNAQISFLSK